MPFMPAARWLVLTLLLGACASSPTGGARGGGDRGAPADSYDGQWVLAEGHGPTGRIPMAEFVTLTIDGRKISGTSACNHYDATAAIEGHSFSIDGVGTTMIGCSGKPAKAEERYIHALEGASTIRRDGDQLVIGGDGVSLRFAAVPPPKPVALENTTWHLNGQIFGRGPDGTISSNDPATLQLRDDGTFTATTGCGKITGNWSEDGGQWTTSDIDHTPGRCGGHGQEQEDHILTVLKAFTAEHEVRQLTLYQVGGDLGLSYGADDPTED
jgi:heat shock protein HslJ